MLTPDVRVWAGFRVHFLLPHDVVGTIIDNKPTFLGITVHALGDGEIYCRERIPFLHVKRQGKERASTVRVSALAEVWVQEPGLAVKIAGGGEWRGHGPLGWTSPWRPLESKPGEVLPAHRRTVHFSRVRWLNPAKTKPNPEYTTAIHYRDRTGLWRLFSNGRFSELLDHPPGPVPWRGCQVFSKGYEVAGTASNPCEKLRRWELAPLPPDTGQMYFLGWTGGAGVITNAEGETPEPGTVVTEGMGYDKLWNPHAFRRMLPGAWIEQTVRMAREK